MALYVLLTAWGNKDGSPASFSYALYTINP